MHNKDMSTTQKPRVHIPEWTFADRLRKARVDAGLDQREFATQLGVKAPTYAAYESGRANPRFRDVFTFAERVEKVTGVPAYWLVGSPTAPEAGSQDYKATVSKAVVDLAERRSSIKEREKRTRPSGRRDQRGPRGRVA